MTIAVPTYGLTAAQYRERGLSLRQQGRMDEAIAALQKAVTLSPRDANGRILLGWTQHLAGKQSQAARALWEAIALQPFSVQAFNALGIVYLVDGDLSPAILVHSWATLLAHDNEIPYYNLSLAYHRRQLYPLAIANAVRAASLEPDNPHPLVAKAIAHWDDGDRTAAAKTYLAAMELDSRYREPTFLDYLNEAGFNSPQIQLAKQVRRSID